MMCPAARPHVSSTNRFRRPLPALGLLLLVVLVAERFNLAGKGFCITGSAWTEEELLQGTGSRIFRMETISTKHQQSSGQFESVLILTVLKDSTSYGLGRSMVDYVSVIDGLDHPAEELSLAMLVSNADEYMRLRCTFAAGYALPDGHRKLPGCSRSGNISILLEQLPKLPPFRDIMILLRPDLGMHIVSRVDRHAPRVQGARRSLIARARNVLLMTALAPQHAAALWLDADMVHVPAGLLGRMLRSGKHVLVPMTGAGSVADYDKSSWAGRRTEPDMVMEMSVKGGLFVPGPVKGENKRLSDLRRESSPEEFPKLDAVGGAVLFVRADVHRQGGIFPPRYIVGGDWEHEGYDGIETDGLCYLVKYMGFTCHGMPYEQAMHTPE